MPGGISIKSMALLFIHTQRHSDCFGKMKDQANTLTKTLLDFPIESYVNMVLIL